MRALIATALIGLALGCSKKANSDKSSDDTQPGAGKDGASQAGSSRTPPPGGWEQFQFPEARFKIYFPAKPDFVYAQDAIKEYAVHAKPFTCTVRVETAPADKLDEVLTVQTRRMLFWKKEPDRKPVTLAGRPAVEVANEAMPGATPRRPPPIKVARFLKTDKAVYVVMIEGRPEEVPETLQTAYFDSFELLK